MSAFGALIVDESGAALTEYGVLMASFTFIFLSALVTVSSAANTVLQNVFTNGTALEQCPPWEGSPPC
ncbi:MAG: hypothetical protein M3N13_02430 [Candidatus Eremiobacteraeota bacterium]|nr:hypothetical protein [Candidatus Eremiobacteraeota bacterium]